MIVYSMHLDGCGERDLKYFRKKANRLETYARFWAWAFAGRRRGFFVAGLRRSVRGQAVEGGSFGKRSLFSPKGEKDKERKNFVGGCIL